MKLVKVRAGLYRTEDGRYEVEDVRSSGHAAYPGIPWARTHVASGFRTYHPTRRAALEGLPTSR